MLIGKSCNLEHDEHIRATMKFASEIAELRLRIPIPITEALTLLHEHAHGDELAASDRNSILSKIESDFVTCNVAVIAEQTGFTVSEAEMVFRQMKFDVAKAITALREKEYDRGYIKLPLINHTSLAILEQWIKCENYEGFHIAITFEFDAVTTMLNHLPDLFNVAQAIRLARQRRDSIFSDDNGNKDIEKYIQLTNTLKNDPIYKQCEAVFQNNLEKLDKVLKRHWRNAE